MTSYFWSATTSSTFNTTTKDPAASTAGTTNFQNDAEVVESSIEMYTPLPTSLTGAADIGLSQSIEYFLSKPLVIASGTWSTETPLSTLYTGEFPKDMLALPVFSEKIRGFLNFRAKIVFRLVVNANPFQQGRLLMVFNPKAGVNGMIGSSRFRSLTALTQLPRVELDLACDTQAILEVPFINNYPWYNLATKKNTLGKLFLTPYIPKQSGTGSANCAFTIYAHFEEVELANPTYAAQMDWTPRNKKKGKSKQAITEAELEQSGNPPLSTGLRVAGSAMNVLSRIPLISSFAAPAGWVLNALSDTAAAWGYSKPVIQGNISRMVGKSFPNAVNADGADSSDLVALSATNCVSALPGFAGTDKDETSITYIATLPAYWTTINWPVSSATGTSLHHTNLNPTIFKVRNDTPNHTAWDMLPVCFPAFLFNNWRGGFKVTLKFAKTQYHSGRLLFMYVPGSVYVSYGNLSSSDQSYVMREILDIRESSEFTFIIPYASDKPWMICSDDVSQTAAFNSFFMGYWNIQVINPLEGPSTVANNIDFVLEVSGADDIEFANSKPTTMLPIFTAGELAAQMDFPEDACAIQDPHVISGATTPGRDIIAPAEYCMGERANSLMQLIKRPTTLRDFSAYVSPNNMFDIRPFYRTFLNDDPEITSFPFDLYSLISGCYAFSRGSVRLKVFDPTSTKTLLTTSGPAQAPSSTLLPIIGYSNPVTLFNSIAKINLPLIYNTWGRAPISEVQVPMFTPLPMMLNRWCWDGLGEFVDEQNSTMYVSYGQDGEGVGNYVAFRSVGDDYQLGMFLGIPRINLDS